MTVILQSLSRSCGSAVQICFEIGYMFYSSALEAHISQSNQLVRNEQLLPPYDRYKQDLAGLQGSSLGFFCVGTHHHTAVLWLLNFIARVSFMLKAFTFIFLTSVYFSYIILLVLPAKQSRIIWSSTV